MMAHFEGISNPNIFYIRTHSLNIVLTPIKGYYVPYYVPFYVFFTYKKIKIVLHTQMMAHFEGISNLNIFYI